MITSWSIPNWVAIWAVMVMFTNSHSYCVRISWRDHLVLTEEFRWWLSFISLTETGRGKKGGLKREMSRKDYQHLNQTHCMFLSDIDLTKNINPTNKRLTRVDHWFDWKVAALDVKREFVNLHPAGADQHLIVLNEDFSIAPDNQMRTRRGFIFFCPVQQVTQFSCSDTPRCITT